MIPVWVIALAWFVAAVPAAAVWYFWDKSKLALAWNISATVILVVLAITLHIHNDIVEKTIAAQEKEIAARKPVYFGFLEPSDEQPLPPTIPTGVVSLLLGNDLRSGGSKRVMTRFTGGV